MRRANQGMRIVMPEREQSEQDIRLSQINEKKKPILIRQLNNELQYLDEIDDEKFKNNHDPYFDDELIERIQMISKEALKYNLKQIDKLCRLAIGKRILNIELKKKKDEHYAKLRKKEKIQMFFRENRIKKYNYDSLIEDKLGESTLVVKAYENGKGFIESTARYQSEYEKALQDCQYLKTIKEVNRIFYKNYSSIQQKQQTFSDILMKIVWIPITIFVILAVTLPFISFLYEEIVLMSLLIVILMILLFASLKIFFNKPNDNNQIEQTIEDVKSYFSKLNRELQQRGRNIEWNCSKDFMYLYVMFLDGFPK